MKVKLLLLLAALSSSIGILGCNVDFKSVELKDNKFSSSAVIEIKKSLPNEKGESHYMVDAFFPLQIENEKIKSVAFHLGDTESPKLQTWLEIFESERGAAVHYMTHFGMKPTGYIIAYYGNGKKCPIKVGKRILYNDKT